MRFHTFNDYASALTVDGPHVLVQDWWDRLEREIRAASLGLGYEYRNSTVEMIAVLGTHSAIDPEVIEELHRLRRDRNFVVHDLDAPAMSADETRSYARRALALIWYLSELRKCYLSSASRALPAVAGRS